MKNIFCMKNPHIGLLIIRIAIGAIFLFAGIMKLSDMNGTIGFFAMLHLSAVVAWLVALIETIAGAAVLLGIFTNVAAFSLVVIMIGVLCTAFAGKGLEQDTYPLLIIFVNAGLIFTGAGKYSLGKLLCKGSCGCGGKSSCGCSASAVCGCTCHSADKRCGADGTCAGCHKA